MTPPRTSSDKPPRRKRRLRRVVGAAIVLALLLLAAVVAIEVVRRSQFVSDMVVAKVQEATGLLTTVGDMRVGWDGSTVLEGLVFTMPLSDEPALTVDRLVVEHEALLLVIIRRGLHIESVRVERPVLLVREQQDALAGTIGWSLNDGMRRLLASLGARESEGGAPQIPEVAIVDGRIVLAPLGGDRVELPLDAELVAENDLALAFHVDVPDLLSAEGQAARGGDWTHAASVHLEPSEQVWAQVSRLLAAERVQRPLVSAEWAGRYADGALRGALHIDEARSGDIAVAGGVRVSAGETVTLEPQALRVQIADQPPITAQEGEVVIADDIARVRLALDAADQVVTIDGSANLDDLAGTADLAFRGRVGDLFTHEGRATIELQSPAGRPVILATLAARGESPNGRIRAEAKLSASGPDWRNLSGTLELPSLVYRTGDTAWDASGLALAAAMDETGVAIESVRVPNASSSIITGDMRFEDLVWSLHARINQWRPLAGGPEFDFALSGNGQAAAVESFRVEGGDPDLRFAGSGSFDPAIPKPLSVALEVVVDRDQPVETGDEPSPAPETPESVIPANLSGAITANFTVEGTLQPLVLDGQARMITKGVRFREVVFEDMELLGTAEFREGGGTFSSEEFSLLEGTATLVARSDWKGNIETTARISGVNIETLGAVFALDRPMQGTGAAVLEAELPQGALKDVVAVARWQVEDFAAAPLELDRAEGVLRYERGVVRIEDTALTSGGGDIRIAAILPLDDLTRVETIAEADEFGFQLGEFLGSLSGRTEGTLDLVNLRGDLALSASAGVKLEDQQVASIGVGGRFVGRTLELDDIDGRIGDGLLSGVAIVPFDAIAESTAKLTLEELEPRYFAGLWSQAADATGRVNGTLVLAPTTEEHAPEPSRLDIDFQLTDGGWRTVGLESLSVQAYIGAQRAVLHSAVAEIGDGSLALWGSTNDHDGERYVQLSGGLQNVDLEQIVSAVAPDAEAYEGRISGSFAGAGYVSEPHRLFGEATLTVSESDLIAIPVINELYSLFSVRAAGGRRGMGIAEMRLDGDTLRIHRADYFNRGLELRASLEILDIFRGKDSPLVGMAVGTARPLAGSQLLLAERTDRMLSAAQAGGTVARITGTVGEPEAKVVPLADLQEFLTRLFGPLGGG